jgi:hypothetical protein
MLKQVEKLEDEPDVITSEKSPFLIPEFGQFSSKQADFAVTWNVYARCKIEQSGFPAPTPPNDRNCLPLPDLKRQTIQNVSRPTLGSLVNLGHTIECKRNLV